MSMLFLQAFVSLRSQHNFNSWYKVRLCQLALSKICNRLIFSLTTASKLLSDTMFQIRYEMKERYLLNIGNSCKGGIKSLSSFQCIYPSCKNLRYTGPIIIIMRLVLGLYIFS